MVAVSLGLGPVGSGTVSQPECQEGGLPGGGGIMADLEWENGQPLGWKGPVWGLIKKCFGCPYLQILIERVYNFMWICGSSLKTGQDVYIGLAAPHVKSGLE